MSSDAAAAEFQRDIKAHAILASTGFLIILPLGILIPRYARTFTNRWFYGHVGFQLIIGLPIIVTAFALGVRSTTLFGGPHLNDPHTKTGATLFILYMLQVLFGLSTHFFKRPSSRFLLYRAPHHVVHIALGLTIISLAFYQVHLGYTYEWPNFVEVPVPPPSVNKAWMAWVILIPILYALGLALLPRQISQESAKRHEKDGAPPLQSKESSI